MKKFRDYYGRIPFEFLSRKTIRVMKLTLFLLILTISQLWATETYSQMTKLSLKLEDVKISDALKEIENQSEFFFLYSPRLIDVERKVNIDAKKEPIKDILINIFGENVKFAVYDRQIILSPVEQSGAFSEFQQQKQITGTVTDKNGAPLPGVNVIVTGTTQGTVTDNAGKYSIGVLPGSKSLTFKFVGMETQEISIGTLTQINATLVESAIGLGEVVVIGYGTQKRVNVTGAIATINTDELKTSPMTNLTTSIGGKLTGLITNTRSGEPGSDNAELYIRGKATLGSNSPLIVVDGIENRDGGFSYLNPDDIATFTVLKDATAAVYGARAANGVILITTKRGSVGKTKFSFTSNYGVSEPTRTPELLNSYQFATAENEYLVLTGAAKRWTDTDLQLFQDGTDPLGHPNVNWWNSVMKKWTPTENYLLSASGGTGKLTYFVSGQYENQSGDYRGGSASYNQVQFRSNLDFALTDNFKIGIDLLYRPQLKNGSIWGGVSGTFSDIWNAYPYLMDKWPNGYYGLSISGVPGNMNVMTSPQSGYVKNWDNYAQSKFSFNWDLSKVIKGLSANGYVSWDLIYSKYKSFYNTQPPAATWSPTTGYTIVVSTSPPSLSESFTNSVKDLYYGSLAYEKKFDLHSINAFIAYEQYYGYSEGISAGRTQFLSNSLDQMFAGSSVNPTNGSSASEGARSNLISRISYSYGDRYLLDLSGRYDGSQNFPKGERFGFFPSVSAGWRISQESFFKSSVISNVMNELKLRGSWGKLGNDAVSAFQYIQTYNFSTNGYIFGSTPTAYKSFTLGPTPNTNITWEVATTTDLGLEAQFFKGKLGFSADAFYSDRSKILVARNLSVPLYTGLSLPTQNIGEVLNHGLEFEAYWRGSSHGKNAFTYSINGNFTFTRNKVKFMDEPLTVPDYQKRTGFPIDSYLIYESAGLFQNAADVAAYPHLANTGPGDIKYLDINNDGVINSLDQVRIFKSRTPEIIYGTTLACGYRNFGLSLFFQGQARAWGQLRASGLNMLPEFFTGRWTQEGDNIYPRNFNGPSGRSYGPNSNGSDFWMRSCTFIRLRNAEISYSIPPKSILGNDLGIKVYVNASNLFSIDKFPSSIDPENPSDTGKNYYPIQRVINGGVTITF